jgi:transcription-repair coupling factor (superfamily II helicase)
VRLEFVGDIVESVRAYDAATQRSLAALDQVTVTPQRELMPDGTPEASRSLRDDHRYRAARRDR